MDDRDTERVRESQTLFGEVSQLISERELVQQQTKYSSSFAELKTADEYYYPNGCQLIDDYL